MYRISGQVWNFWTRMIFKEQAWFRKTAFSFSPEMRHLAKLVILHEWATMNVVEFICFVKLRTSPNDAFAKWDTGQVKHWSSYAFGQVPYKSIDTFGQVTHWPSCALVKLRIWPSGKTVKWRIGSCASKWRWCGEVTLHHFQVIFQILKKSG